MRKARETLVFLRARWVGSALGLASALVPSTEALAGAWLQPRGDGQVIATFTYHRSAEGLDDQGFPVIGSRYRRTEISSYVEYGLTDQITVGIRPTYQWATAGSGAARQSGEGFGDIDVFVRHSLWPIFGWTSSVQATTILASAYDAGDTPARGTGETAYELRLLAGRNLRRNRLSYINLETAYRLGQGGVGDQLRADVTLGIRPWRRLLLLQESSFVDSLDSGDGAPGHAYRVMKAQASIVYFFTDRIGLQAGYGGELAGDRVGLGDTFLAGLWTRF